MMENNNTTEYKVLWVTDIEEKGVDSCTKNAKVYGLDLKRFSNWDDAEADLNKNFKDYSAIILSPQCKLHNDKKESNVSSLMVVLSQLREIFALRYDTIAWYILAFGDKIPEQETMREIRSRMSSNDDWGERMVFDANSDDKGSLFAQIKVVAERRYLNSVLYKHKDTLSSLSFLEDDSDIDSTFVKKNLIKTLAALYDPQNFRLEYAKDYKDYANILRQILEWMFTVAFDKHILPPECFHQFDRGRPNLKRTFDYMAGFGVNIGKMGEERYIRREKSKGEILSSDDAKCLDDILKYFNEASHYGDNADKNEKVKIDKKELFFGYTMKLCHIIRQINDYMKNNPEPGKNKMDVYKFERSERDPQNVINIKEAVKRDEKGVYHIGPCKLDPNRVLLSMVGQTFIIEEAENTCGSDPDQEVYPFIATKIRHSIFLQDYYRATVLGGSFEVIEKKHCFYAGICKLEQHSSKKVRENRQVKKWTIVNTKENNDIDNWEYPLIATEIEPAQ